MRVKETIREAFQSEGLALAQTELKPNGHKGDLPDHPFASECEVRTPTLTIKT